MAKKIRGSPPLIDDEALAQKIYDSFREQHDLKKIRLVWSTNIDVHSKRALIAGIVERLPDEFLLSLGINRSYIYQRYEHLLKQVLVLLS